MTKSKNTSQLLQQTMEAALKQGCDAAEVVFYEHDGISVDVRNGALEKVERPTESALGLRVFFGHKQASLSTSDLSNAALEKVIEQAVAIARLTPEDPFCGLVGEEKLFSGADGNLDLYDKIVPGADQLKSLALEAEAAALENKKITKSDVSNASWHAGEYHHVASNGFEGQKKTSRFAISTVVIAESEGGMERDYDYSMARHLQDLKAASEIGKEAAKRTAARVNPKKLKSQNLPIIFENRAAASLLRHFADAVNGKQVAKGTTFLTGDMGKKVFPDTISIIDDPLIPRGLASKAFDAEGVSGQLISVVEGGILKSWFLDSPTARELGLEPTGHASRSLANPPHPGPGNLRIENGAVSFQDLIAPLEKAFLVTELIGMGVNGVTGDYSRGASGFWIEKGQILYPVNEVTIAGNLKDMFLSMTPASDLEFKAAINAPSLLIDNMTVAGA